MSTHCPSSPNYHTHTLLINSTNIYTACYSHFHIYTVLFCTITYTMYLDSNVFGTHDTHCQIQLVVNLHYHTHNPHHSQSYPQLFNPYTVTHLSKSMHCHIHSPYRHYKAYIILPNSFHTFLNYLYIAYSNQYSHPPCSHIHTFFTFLTNTQNLCSFSICTPYSTTLFKQLMISTIQIIIHFSFTVITHAHSIHLSSHTSHFL